MPANPITTISVAKSIVNQFDQDASDPWLTDMLESTRSLEQYRPYYVAALGIFSKFRLIEKADEVTFIYDMENSVRGLLSMQKLRDYKLTEIPEGATIDDLLLNLDSVMGSIQPSVFVI